MPNIKIIDDPQHILAYNTGWGNSVKFKSKDRLVTYEGKQFSFKYEGWRYRIIEKKTHNFTSFELVVRRVCGVVLVIFTGGLALFSKTVRRIFAKNYQNIRFGIRESKINNEGNLEFIESKSENLKSQQELQKDFGNFDFVAKWIENTKQDIFDRKPIQGLKHYKLEGDNYIFELATMPQFIFKMTRPSQNVYHYTKMSKTKMRYESMILAETVVRTHNLGLLVIPRAKYVSWATVDFIVEQKLDFSQTEIKRKALFHENEEATREAIRQLAIFICKTGYNDVEWRNNPILIHDIEGENRKIALIDVEDLKQPAMGLFGNEKWKRTGLIGCTPVAHHEMIREIARSNCIGYVDDDIYFEEKALELTGGQSYIKATRAKDKMLSADLIEEESYKNGLGKWQRERKIVLGNEPIANNFMKKDFQSPSDFQYAQMMIAEINKIITKSIPESLKECRMIIISPNTYVDFLVGQRVFNVLKKKGLFFEVKNDYNNKFTIQC